MATRRRPTKTRTLTTNVPSPAAVCTPNTQQSFICKQANPPLSLPVQSALSHPATGEITNTPTSRVILEAAASSNSFAHCSRVCSRATHPHLIAHANPQTTYNNVRNSQSRTSAARRATCDRNPTRQNKHKLHNTLNKTMLQTSCTRQTPVTTTASTNPSFENDERCAAAAGAHGGGCAATAPLSC